MKLFNGVPTLKILADSLSLAVTVLEKITGNRCITKSHEAFTEYYALPANAPTAKVEAAKDAVPCISVGRPLEIPKKAEILRLIIEAIHEEEKLDPGKLPGSATDLLDACQRIAQAKAKNSVFSITVDTFKEWLKAAGYRFGSGRTPTKENKYWTRLCVKNMAKIDARIFTEVSPNISL